MRRFSLDLAIFLALRTYCGSHFWVQKWAHFWVPEYCFLHWWFLFRSFLWSLFLNHPTCKGNRFVCQVLAFMKWTRWLHDLVLVGKKVICINIDETPVFRQVQPRKGYVVLRLANRDRACFARVPTRDRRGQSTLLACIVDDPLLQASMPQFVLTNDKALTRSDKRKLATLPPPVRWVVGSNGWVSSNILKILITELRQAVRRKEPDAEIILFMDCATIHTAHEVLMHCSRLNIHVCLIPGGMTYLLQPLDSHVFATFKRVLSERQELCRAASPLGIMPEGEWISVLSSSIRETLVDRTWHTTFSENGMHSCLDNVRARIKDVLLAPIPPAVGPPSSQEIKHLVGRQRDLLRDSVLRTSLRQAGRRVPIRVHPKAKLPPAPHAGRPSSATGSSSAGPAPPLPPPAELPPEDHDPPRLLRSGSQY